MTHTDSDVNAFSSNDPVIAWLLDVLNTFRWDDDMGKLFQ